MIATANASIGVGELAARLAFHLLKTKKCSDRGQAVIKALDYYRVPRGKDHRFSPEIFGAVYKMSKSNPHRGRARGAKRSPEEMEAEGAKRANAVIAEVVEQQMNSEVEGFEASYEAVETIEEQQKRFAAEQVAAEQSQPTIN